MPHTSHKKKKFSPRKREQVDNDGWTRITSGRWPSQTYSTQDENPTDSDAPYDPATGRKNWISEPVDTQPPAGVTVEDLRKKFETFEKRWLESDSWKALKDALEKVVEDSLVITRCILFGTGSFCGLRDGWILRDDVAFLQTAVFKAVVDTIEQLQHDSRPSCFAQEPMYNKLDADFLKTVGITTVEDPEAFDLVNTKSFAYTPGAEMDVALRTAFRKPALLLGNQLDFYWRNEKGVATSDCTYGYGTEGGQMSRMMSLDEYEVETGHIDNERRRENENSCRILELFKKDHDSVKIPNLDMKDYPFYDQHIYYRPVGPASQLPPAGEDNVMNIELNHLQISEPQSPPPETRIYHNSQLPLPPYP